MSEMIERVGRAILCARGFHATAEMQWDDGDGMFQRAATEARAAIEAMREPTGEMMNHDDLPYSPAEMGEYWRAMIEAALAPAKVNEPG